jgi:aspartate/methionine/tyrosine aminotransferase
MPPYPKAAAAVSGIRGSVFSALAHRLATYPGEVYPLHVGDTWMEPPEGCRMEDLHVADHPGMHRYASPDGMPALLDALVERTRARTGVAVERDHILIAAGATGGLGAVAGAILEPGDEVLLLAPYWPLIEGIVRSFNGVPVAVPFLGEADSVDTALELVRRHRSERTVAFYLNTPNNPTGRTLPGPWVEALVAWARQEGLWVISDEVYEDYVYVGEHTYCFSLAPERTFAAHSFSKAFGMAGNRCGYVVGPAAMVAELRKVGTHSFYSTPTASQIAACRVLAGPGATWIQEARRLYVELGQAAAERLGVEPPQGSQFLFLDVASRLDERGLLGFMEDCAEEGVFVAPGPSFGPYPTHIRICFTAAPPEVTKKGIAKLAALIGR